MSNPKILVVDDQPDIRELLELVLGMKGYVVVAADSGGSALLILEQDPSIDLVLLDVQMPELDGWDTLGAIRARRGANGPRVVMCTVKGHPRDLIRGWSLGCDGYVWKPFDMDLLAEEVARVLERPADERVRVRRTAIGEAELLLRSIS